MSWTDFNQRAWTTHRLTSVLFELTYACNLDCEFCYNDLGLAGSPLTLAEYHAALAELADMGVLNLTFSGGEPLAHKDFFAIAGRARELGFVTRIKSNGHALRGTVARRLREEVDPYIVEVSLHGASAEVHDRQTRVPGSFDRLLANLAELRGLGIRLKVNSTLTRYNEHELPDMFRICDELGAQLQVDPEVKPRDDGDRTPVDLTASDAGRQRLKDLQLRRSVKEDPTEEAARQALRAAAETRRESVKASDKHCAAGSAHVAIDPMGGILPCVQWRVTVGNVRDGIERVFGRSGALDGVRETTRAVKRMVDEHGAAGQLMNFCPGAAHTYSGDPLALYAPATERLAVAKRYFLPVL
ncbi:MAG: radical SAM protein [Polyangiales bacterium]|nr:radical SAM protein [Myxococcales bacterium]MCB9658375.1 radical SAM protein [Sandaracinaceae bacterium]